MTVAVHISVDKHQNLSDNFNFVCFSALALSQPDSHFIFIFDRAPHPEIYLEPNCTPVILPPTLKNTLLRHYWYNYKLPAVIQRYNADVCIADRLTCSFRLLIPQCMVADENNAGIAEKSLYLIKFLPAFVKKAAQIFCLDDRTAKTLESNGKVSQKITLLYPGLKSEIRPLTYEVREATKEEFTSGHEYFLHLTTDGNLEKVKIVLRAFSIFKKWQKSAMRMVLIIDPHSEKVLLKELALYKYREDVLILTINALTEKLTGGAYALLIEKDQFLKATIPAMKSGVPVILDSAQNPRSLLAAAVGTHWDEKNIAEKMMVLYKDESMRSHVIKLGLDNSAKYSWEMTSQTIWNVLTNLMHPQTA